MDAAVTAAALMPLLPAIALESVTAWVRSRDCERERERERPDDNDDDDDDAIVVALECDCAFIDLRSN